MSMVGRLASRLLRAVVRHAPAHSQDWANAMLRELDFLDSDWAALFWALGSTTAILRHSFRLTAWFKKGARPKEERMVKDIGKKAAGIAAGAAMAAGLVLFAFGLLWLAFLFFPSWGLERMEGTHVLTVIVIPETIFIIAAVALWRNRRSMAIGILVSAIILATHVLVHFSTR